MAFSYLWDYFPELIVLLERNNDDWDKVMSRFSEEEQAVRRFMNNFCAGVTFIDLKEICNKEKVSDKMFIMCCNALLINMYGPAVLKMEI